MGRSHFYVSAQGAGKQINQTGNKESGCAAAVRSNNHSVIIRMNCGLPFKYEDETDYLYVYTKNESSFFGKMIWSGTVEQFEAMCKRDWEHVNWKGEREKDGE